MIVYVCDSRTWEVDFRRPGPQGQPLLHSVFKANPGDGPAGKRTCCSCRRPEFGSWHLHHVAHNCL